MAWEVRNYAMTVPRLTLLAAPVTLAMDMPARTVRHVRVRIPPGPNGQVGFAIAMAGVPVIPTNTGGYIVGNDETIEWDLANLPDSGAWQLIAYNLGQLAHTLYVTFSVDPPAASRPVGLAPPLVVTA